VLQLDLLLLPEAVACAAVFVCSTSPLETFQLVCSCLSQLVDASALQDDQAFQQCPRKRVSALTVPKQRENNHFLWFLYVRHSDKCTKQLMRCS
jgi:hypothetical protein